LTKDVSDIVPAINNAIPAIVNGVTKVLEEKAVGFGTVNGLEDTLMQVLESCGLLDLVRKSRNGVIGSSVGGEETIVRIENRTSAAVYYWGDRLHLVHEDFDLPKCGLSAAFVAYMCGNDELGYPPLRNVEPIDMSTKNKKKRLSDFKYIMGAFEKKIKVNLALF
jgi:hypothetical protein